MIVMPKTAIWWARGAGFIALGIQKERDRGIE